MEDRLLRPLQVVRATVVAVAVAEVVLPPAAVATSPEMTVTLSVF